MIEAGNQTRFDVEENKAKGKSKKAKVGDKAPGSKPQMTNSDDPKRNALVDGDEPGRVVGLTHADMAHVFAFTVNPIPYNEN